MFSVQVLFRLAEKVMCLGGKFGEQAGLLCISYLFLEENLLRLGECNVNHCLDTISAQIRRGCVEEILIDIGKHASRGLEGVVSGLEIFIFEAILGGSVAR